MNEDQCCDSVCREERCEVPRDVVPVTTPALRYSINIEPLNRGFVVRVGCQSFAVSSKQELIKLFTAYVLDPVKAETDWMGEGKLPE